MVSWNELKIEVCSSGHCCVDWELIIQRVCCFTGITAEEFIRKPKHSDGSYGKSRYDKLRTQLASLLEIDEDNVLIFTVKDVTDTETKQKVVDVMYVPHGSPWYRPARLNGLVWSNKDKVSTLSVGRYWSGSGEQKLPPPKQIWGLCTCLC